MCSINIIPHSKFTHTVLNKLVYNVMICFALRMFFLLPYRIRKQVWCYVRSQRLPFLHELCFRQSFRCRLLNIMANHLYMNENHVRQNRDKYIATFVKLGLTSDLDVLHVLKQGRDVPSPETLDLLAAIIWQYSPSFLQVSYTKFIEILDVYETIAQHIP